MSHDTSHGMSVPDWLVKYGRLLLLLGLVPVMLLGWLWSEWLAERTISKLLESKVVQLEAEASMFRIQLNEDLEHIDSLAYETSIIDYLDKIESGLQPERVESLVTLLQRNPDYYQIRLIRSDGQELIRLEQPLERESNVDVLGQSGVELKETQNKAGRYYINDLNMMWDGGIYVSPVDFNIENDAVELPLLLTVRLGTRLRSSSGDTTAFVVVNISMQRALNLIGEWTLRDPGVTAFYFSSGIWLHKQSGDSPWQYGPPANFPVEDDVLSKKLQLTDHRVGGTVDRAEYWVWGSVLPPERTSLAADTNAMGILVHRLSDQEIAAAKRLYRLSVFGFFTLLGVVLFVLLEFYRGWVRGQRNASLARQKSEEFQRKLQQFNDDEQRFRSVFNATAGGMIVVNKSGIVVMASDPACQMFGYSRTEIEGMELEQLAPSAMHSGVYVATPGDDEPEPAAVLADANRVLAVRKDGSVFHTEVLLNQFVLWDEPHIIARMDDVTARVEAEELAATLQQEKMYQLDLARQQAIETARLKSDFLANMSHEIRTPLNAIIGMSEILAHSKTLFGKDRDTIGKINQAGSNLLTIINDVLDYSKIEAGKLTLEQAPFALDDVISKLHSIFDLAVEKKGLQLKLHHTLQAELLLVGDRARLEQVLINLLGNAIKFTEQGEVALEIEAQLIQDKQWQLAFRVSDTGIGMTEEQSKNIFSAFNQADNSVTRRFGGTGLGLSISRELVQCMGGELSVTSAEGKGSTFWFELVVETQQRTAGTTDSNLEQTLDLSGKHLLVVDDNAFNREVAEEFLRLWGCSVRTFEGGQEVLAYLSQTPPPEVDLVLMDLQMPDMDGFQTTREIHQLDAWAELPVLACSAGVTQSQREQAQESGLCGFLPKPFTQQQLRQQMVSCVPGIQADASSKSTAAKETPLLDSSAALASWGSEERYANFLEKFASRFGPTLDVWFAEEQSVIFEGLQADLQRIGKAAAHVQLLRLSESLAALATALEQQPEVDCQPAKGVWRQTREAIRNQLGGDV